MDISFKTKEGRFNYRVAGIMIHDNKLLIMQDENSPYFYVPGGRVMLNEQSDSAIKREIKEELGIDVNVAKLIWICENFFHEDVSDEDFHEICFYYLLDLTDEELLKYGDGFEKNEGNKHKLSFYWKPFEELKELYLYPQFLKERILEIPQNILHIIEKEN